MIKDNNSINFNEEYIKYLKEEENIKKNNIVILNFEVDDLKSEMKRIKSLGVGEVSELMYVNVHMPYWYFKVKDPDGNILEISGKYEEDE